MMAAPPRAIVGLVGAGTIAERYIESLSAAPGFEVEAIASRSGTSASVLASRYGLRQTRVEELIADSRVNLVLNLTPAQQHADVTQRCLHAGKHVYSEKPLATSTEEADALIALSESAGLLLACAPAVMLWPPLRRAADLVREGELGDLIGGFASVMYPGPEIFHPNPEHLYAVGAGPLFDMGVYGLTALTEILGPVIEVQAMGSCVTPNRMVRRGDRTGERFSAQTPTVVVAHMRHRSGALSSVQFGFEAMGARAPALEIYGAKASLSMTRPFDPDGETWLSDQPGQWRMVPLDRASWRPHDWAIGVTSAWSAFHCRQPFATNAYRARETLDLMCAIATDCNRTGSHSATEHQD